MEYGVIFHTYLFFVGTDILSYAAKLVLSSDVSHYSLIVKPMPNPSIMFFRMNLI